MIFKGRHICSPLSMPGTLSDCGGLRRVHTKEWSLECQLCEDQLDIWWGYLFPGEMSKHKAKKHPVEWEQEQEAYKKDYPYICKYKKCLKRFKTEVEKDRHEYKMHLNFAGCNVEEKF